MANSVVSDPPSSYNHGDLIPSYADPLAVPPLDDAMFNGDLSFPDNFLDSDICPDFNIEDLDFNLDDLLSDSGPGAYTDSTDHHSYYVPMVSDMENGLNDLDSCNHNSSRDTLSGGCVQPLGSDSIQILDSLSPESGSCDQIGSSSNSLGDSAVKNDNLSTAGIVESKEKKLEAGKPSKRKKEQRDEWSAETGTTKLGKSTAIFEKASDDKKKARLMRNRESAHLSRQRKKQYIEELEDKVRSMHSTIAELNNRVSYVLAENTTLKQQLSGGGMPPPLPPPGMYPIPPMGYPWMYPPYAVKQGSHVPLVPIPKLNPQRAASATTFSKNSDKKKAQGKTKKLASISFLGFLFFMLLFGCMVPIVNVKYEGFEGNNIAVDRFNNVPRWRTLMVDDCGKFYFDGRCGSEHGRHQEKHCGKISSEAEEMLQLGANTNGSLVGNSSDPLVASLYVPRNDKLVRIDGNLIIHSVLASDKAVMASPTAGQMKTSEETRLAIARNYVPTYHVAGTLSSSEMNSENGRDYTVSGRQKALGSGCADNLKTPASDGRLKQYFLDDLAGPILSSGMCTEVFQFDVSPSSGSIVPATPMTNISSDYRQNSTRQNSTSRRILRGPLIPLNSNAYNLTNKHGELDAEKVGPQGNKSSTSMVVSVLVDPREVTDVESKGMMGTKSLSRIFVVVLIDSVKYVTYSCMLPLMGSSPHMVTA